MGVSINQENLPNRKKNISFLNCSVEKKVFNGIISCGTETVLYPSITGICMNCDNNNHCPWQENQKMFCEHYQ